MVEKKVTREKEQEKKMSAFGLPLLYSSLFCPSALSNPAPLQTHLGAIQDLLHRQQLLSLVLSHLRSFRVRFRRFEARADEDLNIAKL